jgi:Fe-S-cluster containining protein
MKQIDNEARNLYDARLKAGKSEEALSAALERRLTSLHHDMYEKAAPPIIQKIEEILVHPEIAILKTKTDSTYKQDLFAFGQVTIDALMNLSYGCNRCGACCENQIGEQCEHLVDPNAKTKACSIWNKPEYPLQCAIFPFSLNEDAIEGLGWRFTRLLAKQDLGKDYSFCILDGLKLNISPHLSGWLNGTKPIGEFYSEAKQKIKNWTGSAMPPLFEPDSERDYQILLAEVRESIL